MDKPVDKHEARQDTSRTVLIGLYDDVHAAGRAVDGLEKHGIARDKISVNSSVPLPVGTFRAYTRPSRLPYFSALGAFAGLIAGFSLAAGTAMLYPIATGGKPIVSLPTVGVITYEFTMLGIILFTLVGVLYEMGLPRVKKPPYDPRVSDGCVGVLVTCETEQISFEIEGILREYGAATITRFAGG
ncbi:MAG: DUF3341 domain-containing protein [Chloroflexi bacterium]|nr:DUF3341 domain-containing protein [Chloroflexota bacterium]